MKYMGSKRAMLRNGLGEILLAEASSASRVVDLFCGAASVSWFAATELGKEVISCDLQQYAAILAGAVVKRTRPVKASAVNAWLSKVERTRSRLKGWRPAVKLDSPPLSTKKWRQTSQEFCSSDLVTKSSLIARCYGGHYFSPTQALSFDAMLRALPEENQLRELFLAATIISASCCVAAPGHTAQPFKATSTAAKYLREAWLRDPLAYARKALADLCPQHAARRGSAFVSDANEMAKQLRGNDVVFVDPPYSAVQYSRFYHVLETIARGDCGKVGGVGRYPPYGERPNSRYSRKGTSMQAIYELLSTLAENECTVILTFPQAKCSNGLSGEELEQLASQLFHVKRKSVRTRFSTLGGNKMNRTARKTSNELMLVLNN